MDINTRIAGYIKEKLNILPRLGRFHDIRKNPVIPLKSILLSLFLMPFFNHTNLLALDRSCRRSEYKRLFRCRRKMVASDTTYARILRWIDVDELERFQQSFLDDVESDDLLRRSLIPDGPRRRIGIIDGSFMGGHWISSLCLHGKINYPICIRSYPKRGKELDAAVDLFDFIEENLGTAAPELYLLDALYFTHTVFNRTKAMKAHLLTKFKDAEYREVTKDAKNLFDHFGGDLTATGFDSQRGCSWSMRQTTDRFAGREVQVVHLREFYPKRNTNKITECWIVTTDLSLSLEEIREAAHLRWQIENNVFKRLNHITGTKRFYFKDQRRFINLLRIFCAAMAVLDALIYRFASEPELFKALRNGIKPTWLNLFSQLQEALSIAHTILC